MKVTQYNNAFGMRDVKRRHRDIHGAESFLWKSIMEIQSIIIVSLQNKVSRACAKINGRSLKKILATSENTWISRLLK